MLSIAARYEEITSNPLREVSAIPAARNEVRALSPADVRTLRRKLGEWQSAPLPNGRYTRPDDLRKVVDVMLATGCRISEALALRWAAVDLDGRHVEITGAVCSHHGRDHAPGSPEVAGTGPVVHGGRAHVGHVPGPMGADDVSRRRVVRGVPVVDGDPAGPLELPHAVAEGAGGDRVRVGHAAHVPADGGDEARGRGGVGGSVGVPGALERGDHGRALPGEGARRGGHEWHTGYILG